MESWTGNNRSETIQVPRAARGRAQFPACPAVRSAFVRRGKGKTMNAQIGDFVWAETAERTGQIRVQVLSEPHQISNDSKTYIDVVNQDGSMLRAFWAETKDKWVIEREAKK